jgi:hypothetical protein
MVFECGDALLLSVCEFMSVFVISWLSSCVDVQLCGVYKVQCSEHTVHATEVAVCTVHHLV